MYERENLPPQVFFGALAIICTIFVLLAAPAAMARPAHHPDGLARDASPSSIGLARELGCQMAATGPAHHPRMLRRACQPATTAQPATRSTVRQRTA